MRIDRLAIKDFKNLRDFSIDFDEKQLTTVLIGQNGTGKSNLFEALVLIFRSLDLGEPPPFAYSIRYLCRDRIIDVAADPSSDKQYVLIQVDGLDVSMAAFRRGRGEYLPSHVFAYYSGPSQRMERIFDKHQKQFYDALLKGADETLRPLFYCRLVHSQFVMLVFYAFGDSESSKFLHEYLGVTGLDSVLFVLGTPEWARGKKKTTRKDADPRFWGSAGTVQRFLDKVWDLSLAPLRRTETVQADFRSQGSKEERLYLFIQDQVRLKKLAELFGDAKSFFTNLESTYISDLIREVRIRVNREGVDGFLTFKELSEGEQQLLAVLGLLKFTKQDESLFLLDEPDTHLNPLWKLRYLGLVERVVGAGQSSQLLLATHDPLTIAGLTASQVQIFELADGQVAVRPPQLDPKGLGVSGVLTRLFGLPTTLDEDTQNMLDERNALLAQQQLTTAEQARLRDLSDKLATKGFVAESRDPDYEAFLRAKLQWREKRRRTFTQDELEDQERVAKRFLDELLRTGTQG